MVGELVDQCGSNDRYDTGVDRGRTDRPQPVRVADDGTVERGALHEYAEAGAHGFHRGHGMESTVDGAHQRSGAEGGEVLRRGLHRHPGGFAPGAVVPFVIGELVDERGIADAGRCGGEAVRVAHWGSGEASTVAAHQRDGGDSEKKFLGANGRPDDRHASLHDEDRKSQRHGRAEAAVSTRDRSAPMARLRRDFNSGDLRRE